MLAVRKISQHSGVLQNPGNCVYYLLALIDSLLWQYQKILFLPLSVSAKQEIGAAYWDWHSGSGDRPGLKPVGLYEKLLASEISPRNGCIVSLAFHG